MMVTIQVKPVPFGFSAGSKKGIKTETKPDVLILVFRKWRQVGWDHTKGHTA